MKPSRILLIAAGAATLAVVAAGSLLGLRPEIQAAAVLFIFLLLLLAMSRDDTDDAAGPVPSEEVEARNLPAGFGRALLEAMPAPLVVISDSERVTYANAAARSLLPTLKAGTHFSSAVRAPAFVDAIETILAGGGDLSFSFTMPGPRERQFEARASFLPARASADFGGTDQAIVLVEDRTRDKALLQMRSDFVANASHELRTPLASILGYIETLQGHARDDPEARELFLGIMQKQAERMKRLVDDLMSLSRIEMSAHIRPEEQLDLHAVAAEAASALFPVATQADVLLQIEIPAGGPGPRVRGDRDQLGQVVGNLIDNAIKYGGPGKKVRVREAEADPRHPGCAGIAVIDEGPGIAREHIPRLTERFYRVSDAQSRDKGGTGLGLAITKHILARHSGALDIRSTLGEGSTFTLWVPVEQEAARPLKAS